MWALASASWASTQHMKPRDVIMLLVDESLAGALGTEGYRIRASRETRMVLITGPTERAILFGVGRLLREAHLDYRGRRLAPIRAPCSRRAS